MNNETKKVADVVVDGADKVYGTAVDRTVDRMEQVAENFEKDKETAKKATDAAIETAGVLAEAVADHVSGLLNGEKLDLKKSLSSLLHIKRSPQTAVPDFISGIARSNAATRRRSAS